MRRAWSDVHRRLEPRAWRGMPSACDARPRRGKACARLERHGEARIAGSDTAIALALASCRTRRAIGGGHASRARPSGDRATRAKGAASRSDSCAAGRPRRACPRLGARARASRRAATPSRPPPSPPAPTPPSPAELAGAPLEARPSVARTQRSSPPSWRERGPRRRAPRVEPWILAATSKTKSVADAAAHRKRRDRRRLRLGRPPLKPRRARRARRARGEDAAARVEWPRNRARAQPAVSLLARRSSLGEARTRCRRAAVPRRASVLTRHRLRDRAGAAPRRPP